MKTIKLSIAACLLALAATSGNAASITLLPSVDTVGEGAMFDIALVLDATDTLGAHPGSFSGIVTIEYDPGQVSFDGFSYMAPTVDIAGPPDVLTSSGSETVTLDFTGTSDTGTVGTFSFTTLALAGSTINFSFVPSFTGGFANELPTNTPFDIAAEDLIGASVSVVPLPASVWLMLSALGMAVGFVRRRA